MYLVCSVLIYSSKLEQSKLEELSKPQNLVNNSGRCNENMENPSYAKNSNLKPKHVPQPKDTLIVLPFPNKEKIPNLVLEEKFRKYGYVKYVDNPGRGFALITMDNEQSAQKAFDNLNGTIFGEKKVTVMVMTNWTCSCGYTNKHQKNICYNCGRLRGKNHGHK